MIACHPADPAAAGLIQASRVIAVDRRSTAASATVTRESLPLNATRPPNLPPAVQVALVSAPVRPWPETSAVVVPVPSSKVYTAIGTGRGAAVVVVRLHTGPVVVPPAPFATIRQKYFLLAVRAAG